MNERHRNYLIRIWTGAGGIHSLPSLWNSISRARIFFQTLISLYSVMIHYNLMTANGIYIMSGSEVNYSEQTMNVEVIDF